MNVRPVTPVTMASGYSGAHGPRQPAPGRIDAVGEFAGLLLDGRSRLPPRRCFAYSDGWSA